MSPAGRPAVTGRVAVAAAALGRGEVVGVPTDTVYGLAARPEPAALNAVFELKGRPVDLALPVLVARRDQLTGVVARWPEAADRLADAFWPGPLTLVVPARPTFGAGIGGDGSTVGVRQPAHRMLQALLGMTGPLAVTSANRHGEPPCTTPSQVADLFSGAPGGTPALGTVLDGGVCDGTVSTVVDCTSELPVCRRAGGVPWDAVLGVLGDDRPGSQPHL